MMKNYKFFEKHKRNCKFRLAEDYLTNPTGFGIRSDAGGDGQWGASRGNRSHK